MLTGKFDVLNRQAVSGMRKVSDMRPRVAYASMIFLFLVLSAIAHAKVPPLYHTL